jgi:hypothetical protein
VNKANKQRGSIKDAFADALNTPLDEDLFLYCLSLYQEAASLRMPVENPENRKFVIEDIETVAFTDNPMNRGFSAVNKEMDEQGFDQPKRMAMMTRIMHIGQIFEAQDRFKHWFAPSPGDGSMMINDALLRAAAVARFVTANDKMHFDLDDVERCANAIDQRLAERERDAAPVDPDAESNRAEFKAVVIGHINNVLPAAEWERFRSMSSNPARASLRGVQAQSNATPAELVEMAMSEDGMSLVEALPQPLKDIAVEIGKVAGQPVYYVNGEGIYVWARDPKARPVSSVWLTHPAYPPNW